MLRSVPLTRQRDIAESALKTWTAIPALAESRTAS